MSLDSSSRQLCSKLTSLSFRAGTQATYHWRNKNCYPWAAQWVSHLENHGSRCLVAERSLFDQNELQFKTELPGISIDRDGHSAEITEVNEVDGDVDLGQRKGK